MAKSKGFFGLRKGSTKSMTFSVLRGQQITKDRVEGGANPRTYAQMTQRMLFANAVKFYKHARAGFFGFAFEDKKPLESDYNAFMRHNADKAVAVAYPNYQEDAYPAFGNYLLTSGSLVTPEVTWDVDNSYANIIVAPAEGDDTFANLSKALMAKYNGLQEGDIVTVAVVHTSLKNDGTMSDEQTNRWDIRQFVVNTNDNRDAGELLGIYLGEGETEAAIQNIGGGAFAGNLAKGVVVVFSRNAPSGLKVSSSSIIPNGVAKAVIDQMSNEGAIKAAASTWGATDPAILQGALAE